MNILNIITAFNQLLNLHLNALRNNMMLFKEIVKSSQMCINMQTLINSDTSMIYVLDEIIQRLKKYAKRKINLSKVKLFNKKKMLLSVTVKLLLKIKTFNCSIIACKLLNLKYNLIFK